MWIKILDKLRKNQAHWQRSNQFIYLFGSQASGSAKPDSDLDLLIIWDKPLKGNRRIIRKKLRRLIGPTNYPLDLLLYSREELEKATQDNRSFTSMILAQGRVLYERLYGLPTLGIKS